MRADTNSTDETSRKNVQLLSKTKYLSPAQTIITSLKSFIVLIRL